MVMNNKEIFTKSVLAACYLTICYTFVMGLFNDWIVIINMNFFHEAWLEFIMLLVAAPFIAAYLWRN